jgi:uncharacterized protein YgiM (DUF1202 family)
VHGVTPEKVSGSGNQAAETLFWESIKDSKRASDYEAYLESYPRGTLALLARRRIAAFEDQKSASLTPLKMKIVLEPIEAEYVALNNANVRAEPDAGSARVTTLKKGTAIYVPGKVTSKDWLAVSRGGKRLGYVYSKRLQEGEAYNADRVIEERKNVLRERLNRLM